MRVGVLGCFLLGLLFDGRVRALDGDMGETWGQIGSWILAQPVV